MHIVERISTLEKYLKAFDLHDYWVGFKTIPFAIFNDKIVYLFNHPNYTDHNPKSYVVLDKTDDFNGCTLILFEKIPTAIIDISYYDTDELLYSILVHELFHGSQYLNEESRFANELVGATYTNHPENIEIRNQERIALWNALNVQEIYEKEYYTQQFVSFRKNRQEKFPEYVAYENLLETIEGPAFYVEYQAYQNVMPDDILSDFIHDLHDIEASTLNIRQSCYSSGLACCLLLDIFEPNWKKDFFRTSKPLFEILLQYVSTIPVPSIEISEKAFQLSKEMDIRKQKEIENFTKKNVSKIVAIGSIKVVGFDPMNMVVMNELTFHKTFVKLQVNNDVITINQPIVIKKVDEENTIFYLELANQPAINEPSICIKEIGNLIGELVSMTEKTFVLKV